jgi:hypothetical protein
MWTGHQGAWISRPRLGGCARRVNLVVRPEVERAEGLDIDLGIESKAVKTDSGEWLTSAIHGSE